MKTLTLTVAVAALASASVVVTVSGEARVGHSGGYAAKRVEVSGPPLEASALLGTLVQLHSDECVPLDATSPADGRFEALVSDRATGASHPFDPRLLALLRALASKHAVARIELVSGYRSAKLNEMLRKKGHHVASHSQHSLGRAVDFRLVPGGAEKPMDPRELEREIRGLGWEGGVGVYLGEGDFFVHADVGPQRRWNG